LTRRMHIGNRDTALIGLGAIAIDTGRVPDSKVREGYAPLFEGIEIIRGLPFVESSKVRIYYKSKKA